MVSLHLSDSTINSLSDNELNILKYVYEHGDAIVDMNIREFSAQVSYSSATILRFCRKLGYSGFAEFKYQLRHQTMIHDIPSSPEKKPDFDIQRLMDSMCFNIDGTAGLISEEQLSRTFHYLDSDCPIYVWAPGGLTSILSNYFEKLLLSIGRQNVYLLESSKMSAHILQNQKNKCLLILISTTGNFEPTIRMGKIGSMNHIPILTISPYTSNALADLGTINFRFFTNQRENQGAEFTSRLPVFYVIHMIIRSYLEYKRLGDTHDSII